MANSTSSEKSFHSDLSENEAILNKPVRAAAAKARKTLFSKEKKSSSSGNLSSPSTKSWCSTESGRLQLSKKSKRASDKASSPEKEEELVIPKTKRAATQNGLKFSDILNDDADEISDKKFEKYMEAVRALEQRKEMAANSMRDAYK